MNLRTTGLGVALFLGLFAVGCFSPPAPNSNSISNGDGNRPTPTPVVSEVKITRPADGDTVALTEVVRGTSQNVPTGQKVWVVIFVYKVSRYYPQNAPADMQANGNWDSVTYFGIPTDSGLRFDVLALTADAAAQQAFNNYLTTAKGSNNYGGLAQLPPSATIQHRITVTRR